MRAERIARFWTHLQHLNAWRLAFAEDEGIRIALLKEILKHVPAERGSLEFLADFEDNRLVVLLTHDFNSRSALQNEAWITTVLGESGAISCFGAEGASEELDKEFQPFRDFPYKDSVAKTAEYLLWEGQLGSVAYLGLVGTQPVTICGIEDEELYELAKDRFFNDVSEYWRIIERRVPILFENLLRLMAEKRARVIAVTVSDYYYDRFHELLSEKKISHAGVRASLVKAEPDYRPDRPFRTHEEALASGHDPNVSTPLEELFHPAEEDCLRALNRPTESSAEQTDGEPEGRPLVSSKNTDPFSTAVPAGARMVQRARQKEQRLNTWGPRLLWALLVVGGTAVAGSEYTALGLPEWGAYPLGVGTALAIAYLFSRLQYGWQHARLAAAAVVLLGAAWGGLRLTRSGMSAWAAYPLGLLEILGIVLLVGFMQRSKRNFHIGVVLGMAFLAVRSLSFSAHSESPPVTIPWTPLLLTVGAGAVTLLASRSRNLAWLTWLCVCLMITGVVGWILTLCGIADWIAYSLSAFALFLLICLMLHRSGLSLMLEFQGKDLTAIRTAAVTPGRLRQLETLTIWCDTTPGIETEVEDVVADSRARLERLLHVPIASAPLWVVIFSRQSTFSAYTKRLTGGAFPRPGYYTGLFRKKVVLCHELSEQFPSTWQECLAQLVSWHLLATSTRFLPFWFQIGLVRLVSSEYSLAAPGTDDRVLRAALARGELSTGKELFAVTASEFASLCDDKARRRAFLLQSASFVWFLSERYPEKFSRFLGSGPNDAAAFGKCFGLYPDKAIGIWAAWLMERKTDNRQITPDRRCRTILDDLLSTYISDPNAPDELRREALSRFGESGFAWGAEALLRVLASPTDPLQGEALRTLENIAGETRSSDPNDWQAWLKELSVSVGSMDDDKVNNCA